MSRVQTVVMFAVVSVWLASLIVRVVYPVAAVQFAGLDAVILVVIGFAFSTAAVGSKSKGS